MIEGLGIRAYVVPGRDVVNGHDTGSLAQAPFNLPYQAHYETCVKQSRRDICDQQTY
jgi:hypothetical protein